LLEAIESGLVAGAGLDVLEDERLFRNQASRLVTDRIVKDLQQISSPEEMHLRHPERLAEIQQLTENESLLSRPNVIFTPHIAFNSAEAVHRIDEVTAQNIIAFAAGTPINLVTGKPPIA
jgi:D-lactate dehydrogenase